MFNIYGILLSLLGISLISCNTGFKGTHKGNDNSVEMVSHWLQFVGDIFSSSLRTLQGLNKIHNHLKAIKLVTQEKLSKEDTHGEDCFGLVDHQLS